MEEKAYKTMFENFKQAAKEVFLTKEEKKSDADQEDDDNRQIEDIVLERADEEVKKEEQEETKASKVKLDEAVTIQEKQKNELPKKVKTIAANNEVDTGFISESTKIQGDIITDSNLMFAGEIKGNIESKNNIVASGKVYGNIACKDLEINEAIIEGNITVQESVKVLMGSKIVGDVSAKSAVVNGHIEGNVMVKNDIKIYKNACIIGDISAGTMYVEDGAVIKGVVNPFVINNEEDKENKEND